MRFHISDLNNEWMDTVVLAFSNKASHDDGMVAGESG